MANATYTNLTALEALAALVPEDNTELAAKVAKMVESEQNKRNRAKDNKTANDAKKRKTRAKLMEVIREIVNAGNEPRGSQWIGERVTDMMTPQKVAGVMNVGRAEGLIEYGAKVKGKTTWKATAAGVEAITAE